MFQFPFIRDVTIAEIGVGLSRLVILNLNSIKYLFPDFRLVQDRQKHRGDLHRASLDRKRKTGDNNEFKEITTLVKYYITKIYQAHSDERIACVRHNNVIPETTVYSDRLSIYYPPISDAFDNR